MPEPNAGLPELRHTPAMPPVVAPAATTELDMLLAKPSALSLAMDPETMSGMQAMARMLAGAKLTVPEHLRGNEGDCLAIVMQATLWGMSPFAVAQKTHIVGGRLGYEAQLIVAALNTSGVLRDRFQVRVFGDWGRILGRFRNEKGGGGGAYQVATWDKTDEAGLGIEVTNWARGASQPATTHLLLAQAGTRFSTLWATDPIQQLTYLAQKKWARVNTPEVLLGVYTPEEQAQVAATEQPPAVATVGALLARPVNGATATGDAAQAAAGAVDELDSVQVGLSAVARFGGLAALERAWLALTADHRKRIGEDGLAALKAEGAKADKAAAPKPPAPSPRPAKDAKADRETGELPPAPPPAPAAAAVPLAGAPTLEEFLGAVEVASDADAAAQHLDAARTQFGADSAEFSKIAAAHKARWSKGR